MTISYLLIIARLILDPPEHPLVLTADPSERRLNDRFQRNRIAN